MTAPSSYSAEDIHKLAFHAPATAGRSLSPHVRACARQLCQRWPDYLDSPGAFHSIPDRRERMQAWTYESLLVGLCAADAGDALLALRCALQAAQYAEGGGGHTVVTNDAFMALRNWLEGKVQS